MHLKKSTLKKNHERREKQEEGESKINYQLLGKSLWAKIREEPDAVTREEPGTAHNAGIATDHGLLCHPPMADLWLQALSPRNSSQYCPGLGL